ncbi:hypothetical protein QYM36_008228 [Artemia franciscana]|uniref:HAT C-terminal dimerisation domain-containing protein n=1 Tax=Artemia franciscana TaxID=6661 RepID=A0AA88IGE3_ARTSF|nr:hypothetical protein QYM36_008228 [Artemia franciscana]
METDGDSVTLSKARSMLNNILSLDYICVEIVTEMFKEIRNSAEGRFYQLFLEATRLCRELEITLVIPRKRNLVKIPCDIPAEKHIEFYYRVSIFLPFVDHLIQSLESRLTKHKVTLKGLSGILPSFVVKQPSSDLKELIKLYASGLTSSDSAVMAEFELFIFCVIPPSTACVERSFSLMKRIKTYLCSQMSGT